FITHILHILLKLKNFNKYLKFQNEMVKYHFPPE
ncbi:unnamed protein product, partial [marine sediment metagenome]